MFALSRFVTSKDRHHVGERGDDASETGGQKSHHLRQFGDEIFGDMFGNQQC